MDSAKWVDPDELTAGEVVGQYEILAVVGHGGMARVYRARDLDSGQLVALKVMERSLVSDPTILQRFVREGRTAAAVKHPNVVAMLNVGTWREQPFIAMELLDGQDLNAHLRARGPLSEEEAIAIGLPVIAGVAAAHNAGIVHRDIKPSNVFMAVGPEGNCTPKLLDFGISKAGGAGFDSSLAATGSREIIGTPAYLSPEALNGARNLGPLSDQYSVGVLLYECVVGRSPYAGCTLLELLQALACGATRAPRDECSDLSTEFNEVICRAMRPRPGQRYGAIQQLGEALWRLSPEPAKSQWKNQFGPGHRSLAGWHGPSSVPLVAPQLDLARAPAPPTQTPPRRAPSRQTTLVTVCIAFAVWSAIGAGYRPWARDSVPAEPEGSTQDDDLSQNPATVAGQLYPTARPLQTDSSASALLSPLPAGSRPGAGDPGTANDWFHNATVIAPTPTVRLATDPAPEPIGRRPSAPRASSTTPTAKAPVHTPPENSPVVSEVTEIFLLPRPQGAQRRSQPHGANGSLLFD